MGTLGRNVLGPGRMTCPTAACFNLLDEATYFKLGRKIAFFGDGYQFRAVRFGRKVWVIPILSGEFVLDRRLPSVVRGPVERNAFRRLAARRFALIGLS